jgi:hypothetical protein
VYVEGGNGAVPFPVTSNRIRKVDTMREDSIRLAANGITDSLKAINNKLGLDVRARIEVADGIVVDIGGHYEGDYEKAVAALDVEADGESKRWYFGETRGFDGDAVSVSFEIEHPEHGKITLVEERMLKEIEELDDETNEDIFDFDPEEKKKAVIRHLIKEAIRHYEDEG